MLLSSKEKQKTCRYAKHDETDTYCWNGWIKNYGAACRGCNHYEPAADLVEVVRCKDCKHRYVGGITTLYYTCDFMDADNNDDGYCNYGSRREE